MRSQFYRSRDGEVRLWLEEADIEQTMEDELWKATLFPTVDKPIVDLESFVYKHLGARMDQYAALDQGVLGQTEFYQGEVPRIMINRDLTGAAMDGDDGPPGIKGRWRATVAHEASHVVLHRVLFELGGEQSDLFGRTRRGGEKFFRCLKTQVVFRGAASDWREVQANRGMAALLMPRPVFQALAVEEIERLDLSEADRAVGERGGWRLAGALARRMGVSLQAASIRLETLRIISPAGSRPLGGT